MPTKETRLLNLVGRLWLGTGQKEEALPLLDPLTDTASLLESAYREGMAGLLALEIQRLAREHDLSLDLAPFAEALRHTFARNGRHRAEIARFRKAVEPYHIKAILLKGAALIETVYGGRLGLRPLSDVDLLVKPSEVRVVQQALESLGFRRANPLSSFYTNGTAAFDVHTDLVGASRIRRRAEAVRFDMDAVWERAAPLDDGEGPLRVLGPTFQFLHLAVHALKHSYSRLIWLVDLGAVAQQQDWEALLEEARRSGAIRPLAYALSALERCWSYEIPRQVRHGLPRLHRIEKLFLDLVEARRSEMRAFGEPLLACSIPSWTGKVAYWMEYLFPGRRTLSHDSFSTPDGLLYPKRIGRILGRGFSYVKMLWRSRWSHSSA